MTLQFFCFFCQPEFAALRGSFCCALTDGGAPTRGRRLLIFEIPSDIGEKAISDAFRRSFQRVTVQRWPTGETKEHGLRRRMRR